MKYPMPVIQTLMCKYKSSEISGLFYYHQTIEFHTKQKRFTLNKKDSYQAKKIHTKQKIFIEFLRGNHLSLGGGGNGGFFKI